MSRQTRKRFIRLQVFLLVLLLPAHVLAAPAEFTSINAPTIQESASRHAFLSTASRQIRPTQRCSPKRRALIGAAIGGVLGMIVVRKAAEANGGTVGTKTTSQAGGYGAVLGTFVALKTCR